MSLEIRLKSVFLSQYDFAEITYVEGRSIFQQ